MAEIKAGPIVWKVLQRLAEETSQENESAVVFMTSSIGGYAAHSAVLSQRLAASPLVVEAKSLIQPLGQVVPCEGPVRNADDIAEVLSKSVACVVVCAGTLRVHADQLTNDLERCSINPWLLSTRPSPRRIFVVTKAQDLQINKQKWEAVAALGVSCVVLSPSVWWPDYSPDSHLREACISIDFAPDGELWQRIVETVRRYPQPIHGMFAPNDDYVLPTAIAAKELGLYSIEPSTLALATNKAQTARLLDPDAKDHLIVRKPADLDAAVATRKQLSFPAVCKPAVGRHSEGVFISRDLDQLHEAIAKTFTSTSGFDEVLIQPYIDGPEIDANLVILDGEVLFAECVDDFPKPGDTITAGTADDIFTETLTIVPSKLPATEQEMMISSMAAIISKQGFKTGVFHCEARVRNSHMAYQYDEGRCIPDLQLANFEATHERPSLFLHEVNPRLPGSTSCIPTLLGYGVDYWCLSVVAALQDWERFRLLCAPFPSCNGHVLNMTINLNISRAMVEDMFPGEDENLLQRRPIPASHDPLPELLEMHGEAALHIVRHIPKVIFYDCFGKSEGSIVWDADVIISSNVGREHALLVAEKCDGLYKSLMLRRYPSRVWL